MRSTIQTCFRFLIPVTLVMLSPIPATAQHAASVRDTAANIVSRIRRADYEGDRSALQALHEELAVLRLPSDDHHLASRVRYWRGFALWRRALNGFSGAADPKELERDLQQALRDFEDSARHDPQFVDASVGAISCLQNLAHLSRSRKDAARASELSGGWCRCSKRAGWPRPIIHGCFGSWEQASGTTRPNAEADRLSR